MYSFLAVLWLLGAADTLPQRAELAKRALLQGRATEAVSRYRGLVKELPGDAGMRLNLALALESNGEYSEEIRQLELMVKQKPEMSAPWLLMGMAQQKLGNPSAAIDPLSRALAMSPNDRLAILELADAYLSTGELTQASERFQQLAAMHPGSAKAWAGLVRAYTALTQRSFAHLERTADGSAEYYLLAGRTELKDGQFTKAFGLLRQGLTLEPGMRGIHDALAEVYDKTGHSGWAAVERDRAAACTLTPRGEDFRRAEAYQKQADDAFKHLEKLPESAEFLELRAEADQRQGKRAEAVAALRRAVQLAPKDYRLAGKLAESLWINRSYEEAEVLLNRLVAVSPKQGRWQYLLGDTLFRQQKSEAALPHLEAAVRLSPELLEAHAVLGRVYLQFGQPAKAIAHLMKGLPTDEAAVSFQLGQAYRAAGQAELATRAFARQQELLGAQSQPKPEATAITGPASP